MLRITTGTNMSATVVVIGVGVETVLNQNGLPACTEGEIRAEERQEQQRAGDEALDLRRAFVIAPDGFLRDGALVCDERFFVRCERIQRLNAVEQLRMIDQ
ncbi:hypothetical protein PUN4_1050003 [Paraburkholderia unamae]|nr:hypothetical protein PUN4_1050003 [Paraburkholderia unamae]